MGLPPVVIYSRLYDRTDEMRTVYIRRVNGIYGLTVLEAEAEAEYEMTGGGQ